MDRAFDLPAAPEVVWPWFVQLGQEARGVVPARAPSSGSSRDRGGPCATIDPSLQVLRVGSVIPDWGGRHETFQVAILEPPHALVHTTQRGRTFGSWAIVLTPYDDAGTRRPTSSSDSGSRR